MPSEQSFLDAIATAPADRDLRVVYADWLEDRGDTRADLVRIEEEMRDLPVFADRYWALKPRRNELRAATQREWRAALGYGVGYQPMFRVIPAGWRERWRLIREFRERWYGQVMPDVGGECETIARLERTFGRLPASVREWAAYQHDIWPAAPFPDGDFNAFRLDDREAMAIFDYSVPPNHTLYFAVLDQDQRLDDPPVYYFLDDPEELDQAADSVSGLVLYAVLDAVESAAGFRARPSSAAIAELTALLGPAGVTEGRHLFEADNLLVQVSGELLRADFSYAPARASIPALLWEYARGEANRHGIFHERLDESPNNDDDIPF